MGNYAGLYAGGSPQYAMLHFIHPDDLERTCAEIARQGPQYRTRHFVNRYRCKNGSYRILNWRTTFTRTTRRASASLPTLPISDWAEESLRESEERFRIMADSCPLIIWVTDAEGRNRLTNRMYRQFFGDSREDADSEGWRSLIHPEDYDAYVRDSLRPSRSAHRFGLRRASGAPTANGAGSSRKLSQGYRSVAIFWGMPASV
ncbi:MAG: PAS domain S-box protein [Ignavibacteriota bacterium]